MKEINYEKLNAVYLNNLEKLLTDCELFSDYKKGLLKCKFCKTKVDDKNIYSLFKDSGSVKLVCDDPICVQSLLDTVNDRKKKRMDNE